MREPGLARARWPNPSRRALRRPRSIARVSDLHTRAADFLARQARLLEQRLYATLFEGATRRRSCRRPARLPQRGRRVRARPRARTSAAPASLPIDVEIALPDPRGGRHVRRRRFRDRAPATISPPCRRPRARCRPSVPVIERILPARRPLGVMGAVRARAEPDGRSSRDASTRWASTTRGSTKATDVLLEPRSIESSCRTDAHSIVGDLHLPGSEYPTGPRAETAGRAHRRTVPPTHCRPSRHDPRRPGLRRHRRSHLASDARQPLAPAVRRRGRSTRTLDGLERDQQPDGGWPLLLAAAEHLVTARVPRDRNARRPAHSHRLRRASDEPSGRPAKDTLCACGSRPTLSSGEMEGVVGVMTRARKLLAGAAILAIVSGGAAATASGTAWERDRLSMDVEVLVLLSGCDGLIAEGGVPSIPGPPLSYAYTHNFVASAHIEGWTRFDPSVPPARLASRCTHASREQALTPRVGRSP